MGFSLGQMSDEPILANLENTSENEYENAVTFFPTLSSCPCTLSDNHEAWRWDGFLEQVNFFTLELATDWWADICAEFLTTGESYLISFLQDTIFHLMISTELRIFMYFVTQYN